MVGVCGLMSLNDLQLNVTSFLFLYAKLQRQFIGNRQEINVSERKA